MRGRIPFCVALALIFPLAQASDFRSVAESAVVMYDAPSRASTPLFVASRFYPVEVIVSVEPWVKVRWINVDGLPG